MAINSHNEQYSQLAWKIRRRPPVDSAGLCGLALQCVVAESGGAGMRRCCGGRQGVTALVDVTPMNPAALCDPSTGRAARRGCAMERRAAMMLTLFKMRVASVRNG